MAKKKKGRKARKKASQNLKKMSVPQLIQKSEVLLNTGKFRDAVKQLKIALQKHPDNEQARNLLIRAYTLREKQLRQKGLAKEAEAIHHQLLQYRPDAAQMEAADLAFFVASTSACHGISLYRQYLSHHPPVNDVEVSIVKLLIETGDWQATDQLPETTRLKPELSIVKKALRFMDEADWESALVCLKPVMRRSPWAPVKLLCRAMVCFYENDDRGMQRALSMIPEPLGRLPLIEMLKNTPNGLKPLWQGDFVTDQQVQPLLETVTRSDFLGAGRIIKRLAKSLYPKAPHSMIEQLLLMLWPLTAGQHIDSYDFIDFVESVLPNRRGEALAAKFYFLEFEDFFEDTDDYLEILDEEFPDPADRNTAASMLLSESVERVVKLEFQDEAKDLLPRGSTHRLGVESRHPECILLEMTNKALAMDPQNLQARSLLDQLPRTSRQAKNLAEKGLQTMIASFPDDPQPCLALARLYSEKNAFRKVEACLRQAEQRAPHDEQVRESHVLTLLKTIDTNLRRKKYHLVETDLEKAQKRCNGKTLAPLTARRILFDLEQKGQLSLFDGKLETDGKTHTHGILEKHLTGLSDPDRLKTLGVLAISRQRLPELWDKGKSRALDAWFRRQGKIINQLSSKVIREVLLPEIDKLAINEKRSVWLSLFLNQYKSIFKRISEEDVFPILDIWIEDGRAEQCLPEIQRRLKNAADPFRALLEFYRMTIQCITGKKSPDAKTYAKLINRVQPQHIEMLRMAARRFSKWAWGPLRNALEHFDFKMIENRCNCPRCRERRNSADGNADSLNMNSMDSWDDDFFVEDLYDEEMDDPIHPLIEMVEVLIDTTQLRGASESEIKKHRKNLMNDYKARVMIEEMAESIPFSLAKKLSPEARTLLYG